MNAAVSALRLSVYTCGSCASDLQAMGGELDPAVRSIDLGHTCEVHPLAKRTPQATNVVKIDPATRIAERAARRSHRFRARTTGRARLQCRSRRRRRSARSPRSQRACSARGRRGKWIRRTTRRLTRPNTSRGDCSRARKARSHGDRSSGPLERSFCRNAGAFAGLAGIDPHQGVAGGSGVHSVQGAGVTDARAVDLPGDNAHGPELGRRRDPDAGDHRGRRRWSRGARTRRLQAVEEEAAVTRGGRQRI